MRKQKVHCPICKQRLFDITFGKYGTYIEIKCQKCKQVVRITLDRKNNIIKEVTTE